MKNLEFNEDALAMEIFIKLASLYAKDIIEITDDYSTLNLEEFDNHAEELGILSFRLVKAFRKAKLKAFR